MSLGFDIERTLLWIVLLPLLGALVNGVAGRNASKRLVSGVAVGSVFGSFLLALVGFGYLLNSGDEPEHQRLVHDVYEWFSISVRGVDVPIHVRFVMDHLSGIMTVMVTGIASLIHVYSIGYMEEDPGYARFMTYLNLFTASMLILVLASNLPLMFVGWEGVGLCSYLLIGFWYQNADYAAAGKKAFIVNRIGDFGVLIGMFLLVSAVADPRTPEAFEFAQINAVSTRLGLTSVSFGGGAAGITVATAAALFIFLGCTGKSAQIPLFVWLPDAMAGPTPVSALIHAATMVTAGVYLCCRLSPVIVESPVAMSVIALTGAATALLAASIALVQNKMKRILAYSTVSQLGFMFSAVGMGAFAGGFFHVFTHAFFKACLFLGAGSVMHAVHAHGDADIRYLGGLRKYLPATHVTFAIATAAIAGLPLLSGFFSKDEILLGAATWALETPSTWNESLGFWDNFTNGAWAGAWVGWVVLGTLVLAATMTAFYMFRLYFRTFWGEFKGGHAPHEHKAGEHADEHAEDDHPEPHESPDSMTVPLWVLAFGAAVVGLLGLPHKFLGIHLPNWWAGWLSPSYERFVEVNAEQVAAGVEHEEAMRAASSAAHDLTSSVATLQFQGQLVHGPDLAGYLAMGFGVTAALLGTGLAYVWYVRGDGVVPQKMMDRVPWLHRFLMDKWRVDELYDVTIVNLMKWAGVFAGNLDKWFVDLVLTRATAGAMSGAGFLVTRTQSGVVYAYAGLFVVGLAGLGWWFTYPHAALQAEPEVGEIAWQASRGLGYEYRWDYDSDGEWDTEWGDESAVTHDYEGAAYHGLVGILAAPRDVFEPTEISIEPGPVLERRAGESDAEYEARELAAADAVELPVELLSPDWAQGNDPDAVPPSFRYLRGALVVQINGAAIPDNDGAEDGMVTLYPGDSLRIGGAIFTVAVRVRGTVEVRNPFGNLARGSQDVTLRIARAAGAHARADVGAEVVR